MSSPVSPSQLAACQSPWDKRPPSRAAEGRGASQHHRLLRRGGTASCILPEREIKVGRVLFKFKPSKPGSTLQLCTE